MASGSTAPAALLYSAIAYKDTILAEHTTSAAAGTVALKLAALVLPKINHTAPQKLTYEHNDDLVHYVADAAPSSRDPAHLSAAGLTYLVVARRPLGKRVPFAFLLATKQRFLKDYDPERLDFATLPAYGAAAFNVQLKRLMQEFGTGQAGDTVEGGDAFASVQAELDSVRGIMTENIERVLERGERIDLLVDKTDRLGGSATDFRVRSRGLRRKMWWKNVRLMVLLAVVIVFLIYLLVGFGCGLPSKSSRMIYRCPSCHLGKRATKSGTEIVADISFLIIAWSRCIA
jgi:vesicle-associated membrane protein 7